MSSRLASTPIGSARTTGGSKRTRRLRGRGPARSRLGAGLTTVPVAPLIDPMLALMSPAVVAENRRYCSQLRRPGRARARRRTGPDQGFCRSAARRSPSSPSSPRETWSPASTRSSGCLAHGGMGWIYLARDHNVSDRWVVLKGLLNTGDDDAIAAALAERRFLAEVEHPNIVKIFNFVQHEGSGYIVMEYVGGKSLKQMLKDRSGDQRRATDAAAGRQAIAYMLEILPALGYLHALGLLFCDFKLDNVIQDGDSLKLIDLGGVYRIDDACARSTGRSATRRPRSPRSGPSVASDLYTVGAHAGAAVHRLQGLPEHVLAHAARRRTTVPLFAAHDSLYRLLLKGTAPEPDDRFQSAEEMADQLLGVLREVTVDPAVGALGSTPSSLFETPVVASDQIEWSELPRLRPDPEDPMTPWIAGSHGDRARPSGWPRWPRRPRPRRWSTSPTRTPCSPGAGSAGSGGGRDRCDPRRGPLGLASGVAQRPRRPRDRRSRRGDQFVQHRLRPDPGRVGTEAGARGRVRRAGDIDVARSLYRDLAGDRRRLHRAGPVRSGPPRRSGRRSRRCARHARGHRPHQPGLDRRQGSPSPTARHGWRAGPATWRPSTPQRASTRSRERADDLAIGRVWVLEAALAAVGPPVIDPAPRSPGSATEVDLRRALESTWRAAAQHSEDAEDRVRCVDRANAVRPRTLV